MNAYVARVLAGMEQKYAHEKEYLQAAEEILASLSPVFDRHPEYERAGLLERFVEPERSLIFRVPWTDDQGVTRVNTGYRVQYNSAVGPYKGGMRFHPSVTHSVMKFLGLEQTLKNSLSGLPIGGAKGGSDFDPKGKSENEVLRFCQSMMTELYRYLGKDMDIPAGDMGVGVREVGYLYGQYKRITGLYEGVFTGKGLSYGGSLGRKQATGFGLCYLLEAMLREAGLSVAGQTAVVSGSGNVAIYAVEKLQEMGGKAIAMSDSSGFVVDEAGIKLDVIKQIKEVERERISRYAELVTGSRFVPGSAGIWQLPCQIALPCATQNEMDEEGAKALVKNGVKAVAEGANMPLNHAAIGVLKQAKVAYAPGKAANAGGVSASALEMSQNSMRLSWTFEEVDQKLKGIMENIFQSMAQTARDFGQPGDYALGANIAGFRKVAEAMMAQMT